MKKTFKIVLFLAIFIIIIGHQKIYAANEIVRINFKDKNLHSMIEKQLGRMVFYSDDENYVIDIKKDELNLVTELSFNPINSSIGDSIDLQGIEKFTKLEKLEISNMKLEDITNLKNLKNLKELKINNCQISDIKALENLINLTKLDLGYNQITDISALKNLTKLDKLKLNRNYISDIKPLKKLTNLTGLDLSSNQICDISALKNLKGLTLTSKQYDEKAILTHLIKLINFEYLYLDDNQISDISPINKEILEYTSAQNQKILIKTNKKQVDLPNIFIQKVFVEDKLELTNCNLNNDKTKVNIEDVNKSTTIKAKEGILNDSILTIEYDSNAPSLMIIYGDAESDNQQSTVTITANEEIKEIEGWTLSENRNKLSKTYLKNGTEKVKVYDMAGNAAESTISVKNINLPILNVSYSVTEDVAVSVGEQIIAEADKYVGIVPYVLQGDSLTEGIDCSHFVYRILKICGVYDGNYIRSTNWINVGEPVEDLEHAIAGDVIVWDGHVAFYDGNGKIVEAKGKKWGLTHDRDAANAINKKTYLGIRRFTGHKKVEKNITQGEMTNKEVKVTITSNKRIKQVKGWNLLSDGKTLTKTYSKSTNEIINIKDFDGNNVKTNIITKIYKN